MHFNDIFEEESTNYQTTMVAQALANVSSLIRLLSIKHLEVKGYYSDRLLRSVPLCTVFGC